MDDNPAAGAFMLLETPCRLEAGADAEDLDGAFDPLVDRRRRHADQRRDLLRIVMRQHEPQADLLRFGQLFDASGGHGRMVA
jgi:hypothetical protein